jgi:hypothetical protein
MSAPLKKVDCGGVTGGFGLGFSLQANSVNEKKSRRKGVNFICFVQN